LTFHLLSYSFAIIAVSRTQYPRQTVPVLGHATMVKGSTRAERR
jgi:hypothetical protein